MITSATHESHAPWQVHERRWLSFRSGLIGLVIAQLVVILGAALT